MFSASNFLNELFNLLGVGLALYAIALLYGWIAKDNIIKHTVKCKYCRKRISEKVGAPSWCVYLCAYFNMYRLADA